jgi:hypothetical protein
MKKIFALIFLVLLLVPVQAQEFRTIKDGIEYAEVTRGPKEEPVHMNLLRLDLTKVRLDVVHAMDAAIGLEKTSSIAARYSAFAAINAGFFRLDKSIFAGDSAGVLVIDGKLLSESQFFRCALFITNDTSQTRVAFFRTYIEPTIWFKEKHRLSFQLGINRERKEDDWVVYTPAFGRTTLTADDGVEVIVVKDKIKQIINGKGNTAIPGNGFVISATGKRTMIIQEFAKIGRKAEMSFEFSSDVLEPFEDIVGGVPQLIKNGKIEITWEAEKSNKAFVETRHPRTAVAKLKDGKFLMITVDGRQEGWSVGMNLNELAAFLLELGATDAMNLDGGGSTTMFLDGKVVNKPSDKEGERSVSDAILVFPRKKK